MRVVSTGTLQGKSVFLLFLIVAASIIIRSQYVIDGGRTLLRDDPYYHYRMAKTIVEQGYRPSWDYMASWPTGEPVTYAPAYHYFLAYTFKLFGALTDGNLLTWCVYSCTIPVIIVVVLAFMVGKGLSTPAGGLFCALLFGITPFIVGRTLTGFADTDGFILVFSLLASFFWTKSLSGDKTSWLYCACAGFSVFLLELTWNGYWYLLFLLAGAALLSAIIHFLLKKEVDFSKSSVLLLAFFVPHSLYSHLIFESAAVMVAATLFFVTYSFKRRHQLCAFFVVALCLYLLYSEGIIAGIIYRLGGGLPQWKGIFFPEIGPFISQRQPVTVSFLLQRFVTTLALAPVGLYFLFRNRKENQGGVFLFLALYAAGGILTVFQGTRFLLVLSVPLLLCSGVALSYFWDAVARDSPGRKLVALCCVILVVLPVYVAAEKVNNESSDIEGDWWEALQWIKANTPEDCVVISDWGNGFWIESIAERKSIMNGVHYDIYWRLLKFGKMMQTEEEETALEEIFGFSSLSEVQKIRTFPEGEEGLKLMEKEMSAFVVPGQEVYLVVGATDALAFDPISYFGTWDYTTGRGESTSIYSGTAIGTLLQPQWKQHLFNTKEFPVVFYEADGEFHSYIVKENSIIPTEGTIYEKDGKTYFLKRDSGTTGVGWYYSDTLMAFIPSDAMNTMLVSLYFFRGEGLRHFELVADFGTIRVFKVHKEPQESLNLGVVTESDEWRPV